MSEVVGLWWLISFLFFYILSLVFAGARRQ